MKHNLLGQKCLLIEVESRFGKSLETPYDFAALKESIWGATGDLISLSTIKRLWGYVGGVSEARPSTLDVLSKYVGKRDFNDFLGSVDLSKYEDSAYFSGPMVRSEDLSVGDRLVLEWNPDRRVEIVYEDGNVFEVSDPGTSKLAAGDHFRTRAIIQGEPLYLTEIIRNGRQTQAYVAGQRGGLKRVEVLRSVR